VLTPGYTYTAKVQRVVDGDTVDLVIDLGLNVHKAERARLVGVDTAELTSPDPALRALAHEARLFVEQRLVTDGPDGVVVRTEKPYPTDKYGRWLARVYYRPRGSAEWLCINEGLIQAALAKPYDGGAR
jgi:micrococcal nuclease